MYEILFFRDNNGREPVKEFIQELSKKKDKDSRINFNKIADYIKILSIYGTSIGEPYIKHLDNEIWELRPIRNRILFASFDGDKFVLLHHFIKKTQKTPVKEIDAAKRNFSKYKEDRRWILWGMRSIKKL